MNEHTEGSAASPQRFRKKPVVIEALRLTSAISADTLAEFMGDTRFDYDDTAVYIQTLEGAMTANVGDWIIKGVQGEHYPVKPDIFEETYEPVE